MKKILLIDGTYIAYRSFFAIRNFQTTSGEPTNAVFGFVSTLLKLLKEFPDCSFAVAFDVKAPTFRHQMLEQYKITRKPMPDALSAQIPVIKEVVKGFGITIYERAGYEADDILATIATRLMEAGMDVLLVTGDKDAFQLLSENVEILNPATWEVTNTKSFIEKFSFPHTASVDYLALVGDVSDNIPGVPGIGEKTALKLISEFSSIESLYERIDEVEPVSVRKKLVAGKDLALLSKQLVILKKDVPGISEQDICPPKPDLSAIESIFQRLEFRKFLGQTKELFGISTEDDEMLALGQVVIPFSEILSEPDRFRPLCEDPKILKTGSGLKEKIRTLISHGITFSPPYFDISIARFLTGETSVSPDILSVRKQLEKEISEGGLSYLFSEIEMPLVKILAGMEMRGILLDLDYLNQLAREYDEKINILTERIYQAAGEQFNLNSPSQVGYVLFERLGLQSGKKTKTGYSTDYRVLSKLKNAHPVIDLLLEYRELAKLKNTYVDALCALINPETHRVHPTFSQTATTSGRLACRDPNLQALPVRSEQGGKVRRVFISPSGYTFYSFDYNQVELRVLAHFSEDPVLCDAFSKGRDIHLETARILFPEKFDSLFSGQQDALRRIAKTINFGIIYGMGEFGLSEQLGCSVEEARFFIEAYFARFAGVKRYISRVIEECEKQLFVKTLFGRKRRLPEIVGQNHHQKEFARRVAVNMPIQGTAAELVKLAMVKIGAFLEKSASDCHIILQVHDELLLEIPEGKESIAKEIEDIMKGVYPLRVPLAVNVKRGKNYLDME